MTEVLIDQSACSVVAVCGADDCPWRALTHTRPSAQRLAAFHVRFVHGDRETAERLREAATTAERRRTDRVVTRPRRTSGAGTRPRSNRPRSRASDGRGSRP